LSWTETKILNLSRSDFKYLSDFGFQKNCRIPSDSESATSLVLNKHRHCHSVNLRAMVGIKFLFRQPQQQVHNFNRSARGSQQILFTRNA